MVTDLLILFVGLCLDGLSRVLVLVRLSIVQYSFDCFDTNYTIQITIIVGHDTYISPLQSTPSSSTQDLLPSPSNDN